MPGGVAGGALGQVQGRGGARGSQPAAMGRGGAVGGEEEEEGVACGPCSQVAAGQVDVVGVAMHVLVVLGPGLGPGPPDCVAGPA